MPVSLLVGLLTGALLYVVRLDQVAGFYEDDAWYILLAKALATGQGVTLINVPEAGISPFYPPGLPLLLAPIFWLAPDFPANLWMLKSVSVVAMVGVGALVWLHVVVDRQEDRTRALLIALATLVSPGFVFLATSTVMSEPLFTLVQLAAILVIERASRARSGAPALGLAALGGALIGVTLLIRSIALPLLPLAVAYLLWRRRRGAALVLATVSVTVLVPWLMYSAAHAPTIQQQQLVNDRIAYPYATQFWMAMAGHPEFGMAKVSDLPRRVLENLQALTCGSIGMFFAYPLFRLIEPGAWKLSPTGNVVSALLSAATIVGFVRVLRRGAIFADLQVLGSVAVILLWPFDPHRFLLPLVPFVMLYASAGVEAIGGALVRRRPAAAIGLRGGATPRRAGTLLLAGCLVINLAEDLAPLRHLVDRNASDRTPWQRAFDENLALLAWVRENVSPDALLASHNPAMTHLYTGRRTLGAYEQRSVLRPRLSRVDYWVDSWYSADKFPNLSGIGYPVRYRSPTLQLEVIDLHPLRGSLGQ